MSAKVFPVIFGDTVAPLWTAVLVVSFIPFVFILRAVSGYINAYLINLSGITLLEGLRADAFAKIQVLPLSFFHQNKSGDLISRVINDTYAMQVAMVEVSNDLIKQPLTLIGAMGVLVYLTIQTQEVVFLLMCLLLIPTLVLPVRAIGKRLQKKAESMQSDVAEVTSILHENLSAVREIRGFNLEKEEQKRFVASCQTYLYHQLKVVKYNKLIGPVIEVLTAFGIGVAVFVSSRQGLTLNEVVPLIFALYLSYEPIKKLGTVHNRLKQGNASRLRLEYLLHQPVDIADPVDPAPFPSAPLTIQFDQVDFHYGEKATLRDINLTLKPGEVVALVGPSGAGKSTLANCLPRFYEITKGALTFNGVPISSFALAQLRQQVGLVSQDPLLFNDTLYANILIGRPNATRADVEAAAQAAFAHDFISAQPMGYDTIVGERGARLSGGQRQRIALARAFLKNAPILILDEATSALDAESEQIIQQALHRLLEGKTALIIAHRFSTLKLTDRIVVMEEGRIVGQGSHDLLLETLPLYQKLYKNQSLDSA